VTEKMKRKIEEKRIQGITATTEKIIVRVHEKGVEIDDKVDDDSVGFLYLYWKEWEEVEKFVKEVKNKNEK